MVDSPARMVVLALAWGEPQGKKRRVVDMRGVVEAVGGAGLLAEDCVEGESP